MEIFYKSKKLRKQLDDPKQLLKSFGRYARKINQRIEDLKAVENLAVMRTIPGARCHELTGKRQGELSVEVSGNLRLIFEPVNEPIPQKADGGLDWKSVDKIRIIEIIDYH